MAARDLLNAATPRPWTLRQDDLQIDVMGDGAQLFVNGIEGLLPSQLDRERANAALTVESVNEREVVLDVVETSRGLLDDLDDAIAGSAPETWDGPYRIEAPLFRESADKLRDALAEFDKARGV